MAHLKRYLAPKFWNIPRKRFVFTIKPSPGPHPKDKCIPLLIILRDLLHLAENAKEAKKILNAGNVLVDKKIRKDPKFPVGLMDIIEIPSVKKYFRVVPDSRGLALKETKAEDTDKKICKITGKIRIKKDVIQLNLHDGKNIMISANEAKKYNVGDSLLIKLPEQKILQHFELKPGENAVIISGKNTGLSGIIKEIYRRKTMLETSTATIEADGKQIKTLKDYVMVVPPDVLGVSTKPSKSVSKKEKPVKSSEKVKTAMKQKETKKKQKASAKPGKAVSSGTASKKKKVKK
jgi:small subunit ribosomal protein S4e